MIDGKRHRVYSSEIFIIKEMLLARQSAALTTEVGGQRPYDWIKDRDRRNLDTPTAFLQRLAKRVADQGEQNDTPVCLNPGEDAIDLSTRADHAPDMLNRLRAIELHKTGSRHGVNRFSGGIGNEMQMKARHKRTSHADRVIPAALWIIRRS
jgi:hypothetical protein